ncbi:WhiB family transcriptional regulator [Spirillospora sp. NPDC047418]
MRTLISMTTTSTRTLSTSTRRKPTRARSHRSSPMPCPGAISGEAVSPSPLLSGNATRTTCDAHLAASTATGGNAGATSVRLCEHSWAGTPRGQLYVRCRLKPHRAPPGRHQAGARGTAPAHPSPIGGQNIGRELEHNSMGSPYFFAGSEHELRELVRHLDGKPLNRQLRRAACHGLNPDAFHPEGGRPDDLVLARCTSCEVRVACLALALRAEDPDARSGWYGGLGPRDRDGVAALLDLPTPQPQAPDRVVQATRLRAAAWTVDDIAAELGCSRRTVQRYLRAAAA